MSARRGGLALAKSLGLADRHNCVVVSSGFKQAPWYGTKSDGTQRYDTHVKWNVVSLLRQAYNAAQTAEDMLLLGYSKSGFGAISMLLKDTARAYFGYAASWDGPFNYTFSNLSIQAAFGTEGKFLTYNPASILAASASAVSDKPRIWLGAGFHFKAHHRSFANLLIDEGVPHWTRYSETAAHAWDADGWMEDAADGLFRMRAA